MFCYQCEQTRGGIGCGDFGVCGKDDPTATLQDLLIYAAKGVAMYAHRARLAGKIDPEADVFLLQALFATGTNVNFDPVRLETLIRRAPVVREKVRQLAALPALDGPAAFRPAADIEGLLEQGRRLNLLPVRFEAAGREATGLQELVLYGLKGTAAYAEHARQLGREDSTIYAALHELLNLLSCPSHTAGELIAAALKTGELNLRVMALLDEANTAALGNPEPTRVRITPRRGKAIVVSGHDLADLHALLEQTAGTGIHVYTHGELLPAHGYPKLRAYPELAGNFAGAWMNQGEDFDAFPGAILMTSNCIQRPRPTYSERLFTSGPVAWPGIRHIADRNFAPVIAAALAAPGFPADGPDERITVGFGHNAVLEAAGTVVEAVKSGALRHFFLIGGCDGARPGRNYYTELAQSVPDDCVILTLACGKYRFNKLEFGHIGPLPRLLDMGQCNDAYSAIKVASALAESFGCGVNDLPLSLVLSWYEQKAVAILLTLLHLGIRNIRIGPTLPAFLSPAVLGLLNEKFNLMPITTPQQDLAAMLQ